MKIHLILLVSFLSIRVASSQPELSSPPQNLKILSWNIYMLPGIVQIKGRVERAAAIGDVLRKSDYDVIVFQEAFHGRARKRILERLDSIYPYREGPANTKLISYKTNSGIWIFSKYPITEAHSIIYRNRSGIDAFSRKGALLTEININNNIVQVIGTHLQNAGPGKIKQRQCNEFYNRLLKPYYREGVLQVICGDFNINRSNSEEYSKMLETLRATDGDISGDLKFSYDRQNNDLQVDQGTGKDLIDYILIRDHNEVYNLIRKIKTFRKQWCAEHTDLSDHFAIEAEIHIGDMSIARKN